MTQKSDALAIPETVAALAAAPDPYLAAMAVWLQGKPENTRRSYYRALRQLLDYTGKHPRQLTPLAIAGWKEHLKQAGRADSTIEQRLSAVSSYYQFLGRPQGDGRPLHKTNPVAGVERSDLDVNPYERARKLSTKSFRQILDVIDVEKANGARDRAVFLFYVLCARRRSEVTQLYGRDIRLQENKVTYRVKLKGGRSKWKEMPPPVWAAIQHYLHVAARALKEDAPLFVATVDNGKYLRDYHGVPQPEEEQPITGKALSKALKRYARRAGLDPKKISLHSLRHLGAELFLEASGDLHETQAFLDHAHLNTTQIYLSQLTGEDHRHWQAMANKLEL